MNKTSIEWTHRPNSVGLTWNPIRARDANGTVGWACTHASTGCLHCYAETINKRFGTGLPFNVPSLESVEFFVDEKILEQPLRQKKPATIFVGDMFDLFHEAIPTAFVYRVFLTMWAAPQHTFQLLTKRAQRMKHLVTAWLDVDQLLMKKFAPDASPGGDGIPRTSEPLSNVWCGVSVENQKYADERIPLLLQTPAAVRFLSIEPMLEPVELDCCWLPSHIQPPLYSKRESGFHDSPNGGIHWVIVGGESGPGARPFQLSWAESLLKQCRAARVPFFMKQIGSKPVLGCELPWKARLSDRKGGSMEDWPKHLRVREFPEIRTASAVLA